MNLTTSHLRSFLIGFAAFLMVIEHQAYADESKTHSEDRLFYWFNSSITDAAVYRYDNLRTLMPLRPDPADNTVIVVTLSSATFAKGKAVLPKDTWVTIVPEVQDKCRKMTGPLSMQLRMLLGLHPHTPVTSFVVMKASAADVFRPTADPSISSKSACVGHSKSCGEFIPDDASSDHYIWMAKQMLASYIVANSEESSGYPWTRLGYTYNWKPGADRYGASEYVIKKDATVDVLSTSDIKSYCGH